MFFRLFHGILASGGGLRTHHIVFTAHLSFLIKIDSPQFQKSIVNISLFTFRLWTIITSNIIGLPYQRRNFWLGHPYRDLRIRSFVPMVYGFMEKDIPDRGNDNTCKDDSY